MKNFRWLTIILLSMGLLSGCGSTPKSGTDGDQVTMDGSRKGIGRLGGSASNLDDPSRRGESGYQYDVNVEPEHRVYFEYNSALITDKAAQVLAHNAGWILANRPKGIITIEGHCDERGTREYNLALGQQRADAVVQFLVTQGVPASRLRSVSYGKEKPLLPLHNEAAWSKNRRGEIILPRSGL
ncbi:MAG: peptidoglycan-associated lipoprotein Pal [Magnetococcus sp. YQC-3]